MSLFEPGPWDKRQGSDSAHVFSKKRKLLYGNDHDRADLVEGGGEGYGQREQHRLHTVWRRGALRFLSEKLRTGGQVFKEPPGRSTVTGWPGDLGKHHLVPEELIDLGVISVHVDDAARTTVTSKPDAVAVGRWVHVAVRAASAAMAAGMATAAASCECEPSSMSPGAQPAAAAPKAASRPATEPLSQLESQGCSSTIGASTIGASTIGAGAVSRGVAAPTGLAAPSRATEAERPTGLNSKHARRADGSAHEVCPTRARNVREARLMGNFWRGCATELCARN